MPPAAVDSSFDRYAALRPANFAHDPVLSAALDDHLAPARRAAFAAELEAFGGVAATTLDALARETNRDENLPRLRAYDGRGGRTEAVEFHPGYHEQGRITYGTGIMGRFAEAGGEAEAMALYHVLAQNGESGHGCPLACTAGLIRLLQREGTAEQRARLLPRLTDPNYDTHAHASQFLTEAQGGSDVGANRLRAEPAGDGRMRLYGTKWFCSVVDAQLWLVTARPDGAPEGTRGLGCFVMERHLNDGTPNGFRIRRLKYKLGTRSMASAEIDFEGALAEPLGPLDRGFRNVVEVVLNTSRVFNAFAAAGIMRRAYTEARAYAHARTAFGRPIAGFALVQRTLARLRAESAAALVGTMHLVERAPGAPARVPAPTGAALRMLVNLNKYATAVACTTAVRDAIEVLGGNGAIEEFSVLPRLLRDSIVVEAWEGAHNVLAAQLERDARARGMLEPLLDHLGALVHAAPLTAETAALPARFAAAAARLRGIDTPDADVGAALWRDAADELRVVYQASLLATAAARAPERVSPDLAAELSAGPGVGGAADFARRARLAANEG